MRTQEQKVPGGGGGGRPPKTTYVPDEAQEAIRRTRGIRGMLGGPGSNVVLRRLKALAKPSKGALLLLLLGFSVRASDPVVFSMGDISFNPKTEILSWEVKTGTGHGAQFKTKDKIHYSINFTDATMRKNGKTPLPFSAEEQERMRTLFHALLVHYAMESTEWYENGGKSPEPKQEKEKIRADGRVR